LFPALRDAGSGAQCTVQVGTVLHKIDQAMAFGGAQADAGALLRHRRLLRTAGQVVEPLVLLRADVGADHLLAAHVVRPRRSVPSESIDNPMKGEVGGTLAAARFGSAARPRREEGRRM